MPDWLLQWGGLVVGGLGAYYGAMNAIRENIARLEARMDAAHADAMEAKAHAQAAHGRIDTILNRHP